MRLLTALLATSLPLLANGQAQLLPAGPFKARDGRPGPGKTWELPDAQGTTVAAEMNRIAAQTPIVIDYEHQTLHKEANGQPAPAAGWIRGGVEWLSGKGLVTPVDWTPRAKAAIDGREYAYISPVVKFDEATGVIRGVSLAALTNFPAVLGMDAVVAALNTQLSSKEPDMALLAALLTALGLPATTIEADAVAAVSTLRATAEAARTHIGALTTELGLQADADQAAALTAAVAAVKTLKSGKTSDATVQLVATLTGQVAALTAQLQGDKVVKAVEAAIVEKKLTAAQRDAYVKLGNSDFTMLTAVLASMNPIPGLGGQSGEADPDNAGTGTAALTATQRSIARQLGMDPEAYAKTLKAAA